MMNICFTSLHYGDLTGSELYLYELMRELVNRGHNVTIVSSFSGPLTDTLPITKLTFIELSKQEKLPKFDILHLNHTDTSYALLQIIKDTPAVMTIHSEILPRFESPLVQKPFAERVKRYIAVRQDIVDMLVLNYAIPKSKISLIYNGFDITRFKPMPLPKEKNVLFVGKLDQLRKNAVIELVSDSIRDKTKLTLIGSGFDTLIGRVHEVHTPVHDTTPFLANATHTAGIMLGRTTIEGWLCGRPGYVFTVDANGNIVTRRLEQPPKDLSEFDIKVMTDKVLDQYRRALSV